MTKKNYVGALTIFLLLLSIAGSSQKRKWEIGFVAGVGMKSIINAKGAVRDVVFKSVNMGISARFQYTPKFAVVTNLIYSHEIYKSKTYITDYAGVTLGIANNTTRINYVLLPVMAGWTFGNKTKLMMNAGAYMDCFINRTNETTGYAFDSKLKLISTQKVGAGVCFGLGVLQPLSERITLSAEIRDYVKLSDLSDKLTPKNTFHNSLTLLVGLSFKLRTNKVK